MIIKESGSFESWIDLNVNPTAFKEGHGGILCDFKLNDEHCLVYAEGKTLTFTLNHNTENEITVFQTEVTPDPDKKHHIAVTWGPEKISLYMNGVLLQQVSPIEIS